MIVSIPGVGEGGSVGECVGIGVSWGIQLVRNNKSARQLHNIKKNLKFPYPRIVKEEDGLAKAKAVEDPAGRLRFPRR